MKQLNPNAFVFIAGVGMLVGGFFGVQYGIAAAGAACIFVSLL